MVRLLAMIPVLVAAAFVAVAAAEPLATEEALKDRVLGNPDAPVTIVEYSSLTCPHCRAFHNDVLPKLKKAYIDTGKAKLIYRDFPLDALALQAAMLARCAPPSMYFTYIEVLFQQQDQWRSARNPDEALARIGKLGGMSQTDYEACMNNKELIDGILRMRLEGNQRFGVNSTPTFIIDGDNKLIGVHPVETFAKIIDKKVR